MINYLLSLTRISDTEGTRQSSVAYLLHCIFTWNWVFLDKRYKGGLRIAAYKVNFWVVRIYQSSSSLHLNMKAIGINVQ